MALLYTLLHVCTQLFQPMASGLQQCGTRAINVIRHHFNFEHVDSAFMNTVASHVANLEASLLNGQTGDLGVENGGNYSAEVLLWILKTDMHLLVERWHGTELLPQDVGCVYLVNTSNHWVAIVWDSSQQWLLHDDGRVTSVPDLLLFLAPYATRGTHSNSAVYIVTAEQTSTAPTL